MNRDADTGDGAPGRASTVPASRCYPTPYTKRGVVNTRSPLTASLHWLTATTQHVDTMTCVGFVSEYLGYGPELLDTGQNGYTSTFKWHGGLRLLDNDNRPEMGVMLLADGDTCEHLGLDKLMYVYQALQMKATRVDLAADHCRFAPSAIRRLWLADRVSTVAKPVPDALKSREKHRTCKWDASPTGDTFYMGSRKSTQMARCYNSRGFTRFEMELKKERAVQTMTALCEGSTVAETLGAAIGQFVNFIYLIDYKNRARNPLLPFWQNFLNALGSSGAVTRLDPKPEPTAERLFNWIETQVAPSLAVYEILKGKTDNYDDVRRSLRRIGLNNAKPRHHALVTASGGWLRSQNEPRYLSESGAFLQYPGLDVLVRRADEFDKQI